MSPRRLSLRFSATGLAGALAVAVTCVAALLVRPAPAPTHPVVAPTETPLTRAEIACAPESADLRVLSLAGSTGTVTQRAGATEVGSVTLAASPAGVGLGTTAGSTTPTVLTARGELAAGLLAGGTGVGRTLSAGPCAEPLADVWFTGVGAGADGSSTLLLVNPDPGPATVDVTVHARHGLLAVPALRGLRVDGNSTKHLDLALVVPRRRDLALEVAVSRGRAVALLQTRSALGSRSGPEWLPGQPAPAADSVLLGLASGRGSDRLRIANPGETEARVQVKVITDSSTFAPAGLDVLPVSPGAMAEVDLGPILGPARRDGALGLQLISTQPVTASLFSVLDDDLSFAVPAGAPATTSAAVLPTTAQRADLRLVLGGVAQRTAVTVRSLDDRGRVLREDSLTVGADQAVSRRLPPAAVAVVVTADNDGVAGSVVVSGRGATVVPLRTPPMVALAPAVSQRPPTD